MKKFDVVEVHMRGNENLREMRFMGLVLDDKRGDVGTGLIKILNIAEASAITVGVWADGMNSVEARPEFKAALINDGGYASKLTDVAKWEFPK